MKVLIVWAHPEIASFNGALVDLARDTLTAAGHEVRVTDLYRSGFAAAATGEDFLQRRNPDRLVYDDEQLAATKSGGFAGEIDRSLQDLLWCDQLILQFPLWWFSVPAIMKGWIDRVMVKGLTYGGGRWYDRGGLTGRRAMLSITTAAYEQMCSPVGINGSMDVILWPLQQGVLRFVGFETLKPNIIWSASYMDDEGRRAEMERYRQRLLSLAEEMPEAGHGRDDFGPDWRLLPHVEPRTIGQWRPPSE
ncbi:MAG: NAD(P)H-dependent oxidoreductase [Sphingobium sp.]